jgi:8-oxo-dGTP pyrophosphatase MutT (NUDIX family)
MGQTQDGPAPGEELNPGPATAPRQAASVIVLRDGDGAPEVLLVKRTPNASFMGGVWVFPGGSVDATDATDGDSVDAGDDAATDRGHRAAALRELREEACVNLSDPAELVEFSRWITPAAVRVRFDTRFFLARLPADQVPAVDGQECVDLGWFTPAAALAAYQRGEIGLVFPTIKQLEQLRLFTSTGELLEHAAGLEVVPVEPRVFFDGEFARVLLPGDAGYE